MLRIKSVAHSRESRVRLAVSWPVFRSPATGIMHGCLSQRNASLRSVIVGFGECFVVRLTSDVISSLGGPFLVVARQLDLLIPAHIDRVAAPLGAALAGANWL